MDKKELTVTDSDPLRQTAAIWIEIIESMSHALVNQLRPLSMKNTFLNKIMPSLIKAYHLATTHQLMGAEIEQTFMDETSGITHTAVHTDLAFGLLRSVHTFCEELLHPNATEAVSAREYVTQFLAKHTVDSAKINLHLERDFTFCFSSLFLESVLIQLLNFIFKKVKESKEMGLSLDPQQHAICLQVVTTSMDASRCNHLMNNTISSHESKTLPGLAFCRLALLYHKGDLTYQLQEGERLEFKIVLPKPTRS